MLPQENLSPRAISSTLHGLSCFVWNGEPPRGTMLRSEVKAEGVRVRLVAADYTDWTSSVADDEEEEEETAPFVLEMVAVPAAPIGAAQHLAEQHMVIVTM
mmetsp:Transcript_3016/g.6408  ORF Transcript_3016/g.6408 Transcript_3016/m.6408 type:complete len:101 (+) Transcript_3016:225-527(+)